MSDIKDITPKKNRLITALQESSPGVKLGVAVAVGVTVGIAGTVAIQAYGRSQQRKAIPHRSAIRFMKAD